MFRGPIPLWETGSLLLVRFRNAVFVFLLLFPTNSLSQVGSVGPLEIRLFDSVSGKFGKVSEHSDFLFTSPFLEHLCTLYESTAVKIHRDWSADGKLTLLLYFLPAGQVPAPLSKLLSAPHSHLIVTMEGRQVSHPIELESILKAVDL